MSELKRYSAPVIEIIGNKNISEVKTSGFVKSDQGEFIHYEDYQALQALLKIAQEALVIADDIFTRENVMCNLGESEKIAVALEQIKEKEDEHTKRTDQNGN